MAQKHAYAPIVCCVGAPIICCVAVTPSTLILARSMINRMSKVENRSYVGPPLCCLLVLESVEQFERRYSVGIIKVAGAVNVGVIPVRTFDPK